MPDADVREKSDEVVATAIDSDSELFAIRAVLAALVPLKRDARSRVVDYVFRRLGIVAEAEPSLIPSKPSLYSSTITEVPLPGTASTGDVKDIRSLAQQKSPRSANEMAALVAYYLAEVAPQTERKETIASDDLKTYFKQAGFKLPSSAKMTLVNAKNAGYLQSAGEGQYSLNPVGYNLVVHNLPARSQKTRRQSRKTKKTSRRG
jgi:hypothetical protein